MIELMAEAYGVFICLFDKVETITLRSITKFRFFGGKKVFLEIVSFDFRFIRPFQTKDVFGTVRDQSGN